MPVSSTSFRLSPQKDGRSWVEEFGYDSQGSVMFTQAYMDEPGQDHQAHLDASLAQWNQMLTDSEIASNLNEVVNADI